MKPLKPSELTRLGNGLKVAFAMPFIDDIEDFIWEAIFAYTKKLAIIDPLTNIRTKKLFDLVDSINQIGWSAKAIQWNIQPGGSFELVIQRADVYRKARALGFRSLSVKSKPKDLGSAILKHWKQKVTQDSVDQNVEEKRIVVLLKSNDRRRYAYFEDTLHEYEEADLDWAWTNKDRNGLQATHKKTKQIIYRWHPSGAQLFERFNLPTRAQIITIDPLRLEPEIAMNMILGLLNKTVSAKPKPP